MATGSRLQTNRRRLAIVGTGHRGAGTWGREVPEACGDHVALVGLCDSNPMRLAVVARDLGLDEELLQSLKELVEGPAGLEATGEVDVAAMLCRQIVDGHGSPNGS